MARRKIQTEILINASPQQVWEVLSDFGRYPAWNPFILYLSGQKTEGSHLKVIIRPPQMKAVTMRPRLIAWREASEIRWKGSLLLPGIFDGEHYFLLQKSGQNATRFMHGENFNGIIVGLLEKVISRTLQGFELMNQALKAESEKRNPNMSDGLP